MNSRLILRSAITSALASAFALGLASPAAAQDKAKEKRYGIAKVGQNNCANLSGTHTCAGQSKAEMAADDWKYVADGTCKEMKGNTEQEAKMAMKK